jgi:hypothetical protein
MSVPRLTRTFPDRRPPARKVGELPHARIESDRVFQADHNEIVLIPGTPDELPCTVVLFMCYKKNWVAALYDLSSREGIEVRRICEWPLGHEVAIQDDLWRPNANVQLRTL